MKDEKKNKALCASLYHFSFILYHLAKLCIAQIYHLSFVNQRSLTERLLSAQLVQT
jgi:hypothetical protein